MTAEIIAWTTLFFIGMCFSTWSLIESYRDLFGLWEYHVDGDAEGEARLVIGSEMIRLAELVAGFLTGVCALLHIFPNAIIWLLFILPVGITLNTMRTVRFRVKYSRAHQKRRQVQRRRRDEDGSPEHPTV